MRPWREAAELDPIRAASETMLMSALRCATPRKMTPEESLDTLWDQSIGAWVWDLCRDGLEAAILKPLAQCRSASLHLVDRMRGSDNFAERKLAATIVGFLGVHA